MRLYLTRLRADECGGVLVEVTILLVIFMLLVLGSVDFLMALYQWNAATKAVQLGASIASRSNPVASGFTSITGPDGGAPLGSPMPPGSYATRDCSGASGGSCTVGTYDAAAMNVIVCGRKNAAAVVNGKCQPAACLSPDPAYCAGMQDMFWRIKPENVGIEYASTGLGYAGRPGGPVPTITISLQNLAFQFYFLPFPNHQMQVSATATGEDLSSSAPPP
jgi:TadE-like protein